MRRCTIILPDAGPINSLWVADRLDLLLALDMRLVVVDAVYDELTSDLSYPKDIEVKRFIDGHQPPFIIEETDIGRLEREKRRLGQKPKKNAGELAMVDFMSSEDGLARYLRADMPVAVLFEDAGLRVISKPPNLHLLSTVGLLRGLADVGIIASADDVIDAMLHPTAPGRRPADARRLTDLPAGTDEAAAIGSSWRPRGPRSA
jgi:predicted nucleic acid-binding protein